MTVMVNAPDNSESKDLVVDRYGRAFGRGAVEVLFNGEPNMVFLEAKQVELLLKILNVVEYEPKSG